MLFDDKKFKNLYQQFKSHGTLSNVKAGRGFTTEMINRLFLEHPELRLADNPANIQLAQMLIADSGDMDLQEILSFIVNNQMQALTGCDDEFIGNYPSANSLSYPSDFIDCATMPTGEPAGICIDQFTGNIGFLGRTKSGKTTNLMNLLSFPKLLEKVCIIAFVKKREIRDLGVLPALSNFVFVFTVERELKFSLFQPPPGVPEMVWCNEMTRITGQCYARYTAQRLMGRKLDEIMAGHPQGSYPTLRQLVESIECYQPPRFSTREITYKESILAVLSDLLRCTGNIWDYSSSNFLEQLFSKPGLYIFESEALPSEHLTFIATYMMRWLYLRRIYK